MFRGTCKINISIDDVNPKPGWRIIGEPTQKYLEQLNKDFGSRVTLFIPANHHGNAELSENKSWINELKEWDFIEFGAHGYYHDTSNRNLMGECEFAAIDDADVYERLQMISYSWLNSLGKLPKVWKSPGWLTSRQSANLISSEYDIAVVHPIHNHNLLWSCSTINATDYSPPNNFPGMDCNIFILSHIHGKHDNAWSDSFYNYVRRTLEVLKTNISNTEMCFIQDL